MISVILLSSRMCQRQQWSSLALTSAILASKLLDCRLKTILWSGAIVARWLLTQRSSSLVPFSTGQLVRLESGLKLPKTPVRMPSKISQGRTSDAKSSRYGFRISASSSAAKWGGIANCRSAVFFIGYKYILHFVAGVHPAPRDRCPLCSRDCRLDDSHGIGCWLHGNRGVNDSAGGG